MESCLEPVSPTSRLGLVTFLQRTRGKMSAHGCLPCRLRREWNSGFGGGAALKHRLYSLGCLWHRETGFWAPGPRIAFQVPRLPLFLTGACVAH